MSTNSYSSYINSHTITLPNKLVIGEINYYEKYFSLDHFTQISQDWNEHPYTSVILKTTEIDQSCPSSHPYEVLQKT